MNSGSRDSVIGTQTMRKVGNSGVHIQVGARDFCPKRPQRLWGPTSPRFNGYWVISRRQNAQGEKLTMHLHLVPKLRISGAIPPLPLHVFMAWEGKSFIQTDQPPSPSPKIRSSVIK